jgi:hypothetical protein
MSRPLLLALGLLAACTEGEAPDDDLQAIHPPEIARIVPAGEALAGAHVPTLDPSTMNDAEIGKALAAGARCDFRYTSSGRPVLAVRMQPGGDAAGAIVKLNGHLVPLEATRADAGELQMRAEPVHIVIQPDPQEPAKARPGIQRREANMIFEVGKELRAGYRGYLDCGVEPHRQAGGG